jgi:tetratricopeptide (TPR) repeat protein
LFSKNSFAQQSTDEIENEFEKKFYKARMVFHKTYFEKASILFDSLIIEKQDYALSYGYAAMIDMLLYRNPSQNIEKARSLIKETDVNHLFTLGICSFANGDLPDCESKMKEFLSKNPDNKYGMHVLGFTQIDAGRPEEGLKTLKELLNKNPSYYPAYNHIGYAFISLQQNEHAINAFDEFLKSDTQNPSALDSYSEGLNALGEYDKAIAYLTKAVLLEPGFAYAWKHMGDIFAQNGEFNIAIHAYENAKKSAKLYGEDFFISIDNKIEELK